MSEEKKLSERVRNWDFIDLTRDDLEAQQESLADEIAALEKRLAEAGWQPIETLQKGTRKMFVAIAFNVDTGLSAPGGGYRYTTDPWCVWYSNGEFVRWPHPFPPTHWMPLPPPPQENTHD